MAKVGPKTDVDEEVDVSTRVDEGLAKLYETYQKHESQNQLRFVQIVEYVKDNKLSRATVKATLESRGLSASSVSSEVSRIMGLVKPEAAPILEKLTEGEIGIAAARKALVKSPHAKEEKTAADKLWEMIYRAARYAFKEHREGQEEFTLSYVTTEMGNAWNQVKDEYEAKERAAEEAARREAEEEAEEAEAATA